MPKRNLQVHVQLKQIFPIVAYDCTRFASLYIKPHDGIQTNIFVQFGYDIYIRRSHS